MPHRKLGKYLRRCERCGNYFWTKQKRAKYCLRCSKRRKPYVYLKTERELYYSDSPN